MGLCSYDGFCMKNIFAIQTYIDKLTSSKMSKQRLKYVIKIIKDDVKIIHHFAS
jgi:hypothetical protein